MFASLVVVLASSLLAGGNNKLGPGAGPWHLSDPASVGLSRAKLEKAGNMVGEDASPYLCACVYAFGSCGYVLSCTHAKTPPSPP